MGEGVPLNRSVSPILGISWQKILWLPAEAELWTEFHQEPLAIIS
jgi:hypothetical protein